MVTCPCLFSYCTIIIVLNNWRSQLCALDIESFIHIPQPTNITVCMSFDLTLHWIELESDIVDCSECASVRCRFNKATRLSHQSVGVLDYFLSCSSSVHRGQLVVISNQGSANPN